MVSPLLKLPAELRNTIYHLVLDNVTTLEIGHGGCLDHRPALLCVNRQMRDEASPIFTHIACLAASEITARVHNFEFSAITAFISTLSQEQIRALDKRRSLRIQLTMDDTFETGKDALACWLRIAGLTLGSKTTSGVYEFKGAVSALPLSWDTDFQETVFSMQDNSSYRTYHRNAMARQEWDRVKLSLIERSNEIHREEVRKRDAARTAELVRKALERDERHRRRCGKIS